MSLSFKEELMLLAILNRNNLSYGTEIIEDVSQASGGRIQLDYGFIFPTLRKLCGRERRLIKRLPSDYVSIETGGYRRVYYEITELGKEALLEAYNTRRNLCGKGWLRLVMQVIKKRLIPLVRGVLRMSLKEELILLAILNRNNSSYGTEIIEDVSKASGGRIQLDYGFIFPTLRKLCGRERRLIKRLPSDDVSIRTGGYRRVYYEITELGKEALLEADNIRRNVGGKGWLRLINGV